MKRLAHLGVVAGLVFASAWASPAQDLLDEAVYNLSTLYAGSQRARLQGLGQKYQTRLEEACAEQKENCALEIGVDVVEAMLGELGDPHTRLLLPEQYQGLGLVVGDEARGRLGLGLRLAAPDRKAGLVVLWVQPGSPAERAGLRRGDRLLRLNGRLLLGAPRARLEAFFAAQGGEAEVTLGTLRGNQGQTVRLRPATLETDTARLEMLPGDIAHLSIASFVSARVAATVNLLVKEAQQKGAKGLVLDLRNNGGGLVDQQLLVAGIFVNGAGRRLEGGLLGEVEIRNQGGRLSRRDRSGERTVGSLPQPARWQGPLVVLVNEGSASAAEFLSLDLQDAGFQVLGEPTYGVADTVVNFVRLSGGPALVITTNLTRRLDGRPYPEKVTPDLSVPDDLEALAEGRDVPLQRALELLAQPGG